MKTYQWPYPNEVGQEEVAECDVLVLGGGLAGCFAAIAGEKRVCRYRSGSLGVSLHEPLFSGDS